MMMILFFAYRDLRIPTPRLLHVGPHKNAYELKDNIETTIALNCVV